MNLAYNISLLNLLRSAGKQMPPRLVLQASLDCVQCSTLHVCNAPATNTL